MRAMGIDTGTTTISIVLVDEDSGAVVARRTIEHRAFIDDGCPVGRVQDPERIRALVLEAVEAMIDTHGAPSCIGLTGQMHGMLYVDAKGRAVSPLYTWQDGRAGLPLADGQSAVGLLRDRGCAAASGYGLSTHLHLLKTGGVPEDATGMATLSDYIAMALTGKASPVLSADMAASWGCFDLKRGVFQTDALEALGIDSRLLPEVCRGYPVMGETLQGIPVACSAGDNQASFLGAVRDFEDTLLINVGTGSQVSVGTSRFIECSGDIELRPCGTARYILAGSGLCGGRAYALLEQFYREAAGTDAPRYDTMLKQAEDFLERRGLDAAWRVRTAFSGTRSNPDGRGRIDGIDIDNFTPGALTVGVVAGILGELREYFEQIRMLTGREPSYLVGSGNGLRRNPLMRRLAEHLFGLSLRVPAHEEEAAFGAVLCAMAASGRKPSLEAAQGLISYK